MAKYERKKLEKKNWTANFALIGEAKVNDFTFKIDEKSEKSDWVYNVLNLGVDCGEKHGVVYTELMGGYGSERDNILYVHGKKEDGKDDFDNRFTIDWDDRFDESVLSEIGEMCFLTVGLEKDKKDKTFYKKFLSPYDAIAYIKENLQEGTVLNVKGNLKYQLYNDNVTVKKEITSIVLSGAEDSSKYRAKFTQTLLLTKDSLDKPDKDKGVLPVYAKVLEYVKDYKGKEVKQFIPITRLFEYEVDLTKRELVEKVVAKLFKVKKGVTEITFEGDFVEGGAVVTATEDDLPQDIKDLIEIGAYTLEEALAKCTVGGGKERRMILRKPVFKMVGEEGKEVPVVQKTEEKYAEEDLILDFMIEFGEEEEAEEDQDDNNEDDAENVEETSTEEDNSWLDNL
ncbi:MAG: hypothetical protein K0R54_2773 [Clostridiaceae bacterium]|jgi:hypothetical protein|nr:hypothetical protein [Clostridiaceae bacterium]MDF2950491.1 hypothetical protein [Anaerocolumna sp.]